MRTGEPPIRVAVANEYDLVIAGLTAMLEPYGQEVEVEGAVTLDEPVPLPVDIVLYDTYGTAEEESKEIHELGQIDGVGRVVLFTSTPRPEQSKAAMDAGAAGVLSKARSAASLVEGLQQIHAGEEVIDGGGGAQRAPWPGADLGLTARQSEVVALLLHGMTNAEIADALDVDVNTVKTHLRHIYQTLGTRRRSQVLARLLTGEEFARR